MGTKELRTKFAMIRGASGNAPSPPSADFCDIMLALVLRCKCELSPTGLGTGIYCLQLLAIYNVITQQAVPHKILTAGLRYVYTAPVPHSTIEVQLRNSKFK